MDQLLGALDKLDADAVLALFAPDSRVVTADGRRGEGLEAVRELIADFIHQLRATTHRITAQWHVDNVWIAEVQASYELTDWLQTSPLPRVFVLRDGPQGIVDLRVYGAHERPLSDHHTGEEGMWVGTRWIPPL
jgi:hypothetical protein